LRNSLPASASRKVSVVATGRGIELNVLVTSTPARVAGTSTVVADAVPRNDAQPAIGARQRAYRHAGRVDVDRAVARRVGIVTGTTFGGYSHSRSDAESDLQRARPRRRLAAGVEDVARKADAEFGAHRAAPSRRPHRAARQSAPQRFLQQQLVDAVEPSGETPWRRSRAQASSVAKYRRRLAVRRAGSEHAIDLAARYAG
jgi:hypothetical protein